MTFFGTQIEDRVTPGGLGFDFVSSQPIHILDAEPNGVNTIRVRDVRKQDDGQYHPSDAISSAFAKKFGSASDFNRKTAEGIVIPDALFDQVPIGNWTYNDLAMFVFAPSASVKWIYWNQNPVQGVAAADVTISSDKLRLAGPVLDAMTTQQSKLASAEANARTQAMIYHLFGGASNTSLFDKNKRVIPDSLAASIPSGPWTLDDIMRNTEINIDPVSNTMRGGDNLILSGPLLQARTNPASLPAPILGPNATGGTTSSDPSAPTLAASSALVQPGTMTPTGSGSASSVQQAAGSALSLLTPLMSSFRSPDLTPSERAAATSSPQAPQTKVAAWAVPIGLILIAYGFKRGR